MRVLGIAGFLVSLLMMVANSGRSRIHAIARLAAISIALSVEPLKPKWKSMAAIFLTTLISAIYWGPHDFLAEDLLLSPQLPVQIVSASVQAGGECITVLPDRGGGVIATVCFYQGDMAVIAAHPVDLEDGPWPLKSVPHIPVAMIRGTPEFIASTPYGAVLRGLGPPVENREFMKIASDSEIAVGEQAELRSSWKGTVPVRILGFTMRREEQYLVFQLCDEEDVFERGMSGSPIVQSGKIVGFAAWHSPAISWKRPQIAFARLASDIYLGTQSYMERP